MGNQHIPNPLSNREMIMILTQSPYQSSPMVETPDAPDAPDVPDALESNPLGVQEDASDID